MSPENVAITIDELYKNKDVEGLIALLRSNFKSMYAGIIVETLGKMNDPRAAPVLLELFNADAFSSSVPLDETIKVMGILKDPSAVPALISFIKSRDLTIKKGQAVASIARVQILVESAIKALGEIQDPRAIDILIKIIKRVNSVGEGSTHRLAVSALANIGDRHAVPALIDALQSKDDRVNAPAAMALGNLGDNRAVPALIGIINKRDDRSLLNGNLLIKRESAEALGKIGDRRAIKPLHAFLASLSINDNRRETITKALQALGENI
jgi:HEAT repeat protein